MLPGHAGWRGVFGIPGISIISRRTVMTSFEKSSEKNALIEERVRDLLSRMTLLFSNEVITVLLLMIEIAGGQ